MNAWFSRKRVTRLLALCTVAALFTGCTILDVAKLASDETAGRDNGTPGSALARQYLIEQLRPIAVGANTSGIGDAAYTQSIPGGTNVVAILRGTDLADQYVVVGAHYDHVGSSCRTSNPADTICNGATDNAAGVAAALAIARSLASSRPRRSVVFAFWDREEDGLLGSQTYVENPLVPLANTVAYVNFDVYGDNVAPSLRNTTFAIGAESGGSTLRNAVRTAIDEQTLDALMLSVAFGQGRSDHVSFLNARVPSIFFTDATGPCYHTAQDETGIVDFEKLDHEIAIALRVTRDMANVPAPPPFVSGAPLVSYDDVLALARTVERLWNDRDRLSSTDRATVSNVREHLQRLVAEGRDAFGPDDFSSVLLDAASLVTVLTHGACDGFLAPQS